MDRPSRCAPHDLAAASQALRALGELRQALDAMLAEAQRQIRRIATRTDRRCAPLRRRAHALEQNLERFCAAHPELLGANQRLDLPDGSLGFTTRHALHPLPGHTWAQIAPRLARENLPPDPASPAGVAPKVLASLPLPTLQSLGIASAASTTFWCSPAMTGGEK